MKDTFYFSHDQNARGDEKIIALLRGKGWAAYGLYWALVEKLYEDHGSIAADFELLAWDLHADANLLKAVANDFDLFYVKGGRLRSRSVDRRIAERQERVEAARQAGIKSGRARAERSLNGRSTDPELERKKRKKEITAAPAAADLAKKLSTTGDKLGITREGKDLMALQLPFTFGDIPKGRTVIDIDPASAKQMLERVPRLGLDLRRALQARIDMKTKELHPQFRKV